MRLDSKKRYVATFLIPPKRRGWRYSHSGGQTDKKWYSLYMNPGVVQAVGILIAIGPIVHEVLSKYAANEPINWILILSAAIAAIGGSQAAKRLTDTSAKHVDAVVAKKVEAKLRESVKPLPPDHTYQRSFFPPPEALE